MNDTRVTRVLILAEPAIGQHWKKMLCGPETQVWLGRSAIPARERPEIILTNVQMSPISPRDETGVIQVGGDGPADVHLSEQFTAEELQLACRLLGEVVRLRRLQQKSIETHLQLTQAAMTDPLTGIANRRAWNVELTERLTRAGNSQRRLCLALLDLDQFKEINDTLGHAAGDRILQAVSHSLVDNLRHDDFVARLGGDEFGLLIWVPGEAEAAEIIERVRGCVADTVHGIDAIQITAGTGFALSGASSQPDTCESLFLAADTALIAAKRERRQELRPYAPTAMEQP